MCITFRFDHKAAWLPAAGYGSGWKLALFVLTEQRCTHQYDMVAVDCAIDGIRASIICPGTVHTPFVEEYLERNCPGRKDVVGRLRDAGQPSGRMGQPQEIANAASQIVAPYERVKRGIEGYCYFPTAGQQGFFCTVYDAVRQPSDG